MLPPVLQTDRLRYARGLPHVLQDEARWLKERHDKEGPKVGLGLAARSKRNRRALQAGLAGQT